MTSHHSFSCKTAVDETSAPWDLPSPLLAGPPGPRRCRGLVAQKAWSWLLRAPRARTYGVYNVQMYNCTLVQYIYKYNAMYTHKHIIHMCKEIVDVNL